MWNYCKAAGGIALICLGIATVIGGLGYAILFMEHNMVDYKAEVDLKTYGTKFEAYVIVCKRNGVPAQVCILAWPNGARK